MAKKLYVGNLSFSTTEETLNTTFSAFGQVVSATIIMDRNTQKSKGFGFVEMNDEGEADSAINTLNGKELDGRKIRVSPAEEKAPRRSFDNNGDNRNRGERRPFNRGNRSYSSRQNDRGDRSSNDNNY